MSELTARRTAFQVLRDVSASEAYGNLALAKRLSKAQLTARDTAFVTELALGTLRLQGTYDRILERAAGRKLKSLQPAVVDLLRLGTHQLLNTKVPARAAVATSVALARVAIGARVTGLVNAILRKVAARDLEAWLELLCEGLAAADAQALKGHHPRWIRDAYAQVLPAEQVSDALAANNLPAMPNLAVRPGRCEVTELLEGGATATSWSPFGACHSGNPAKLPAVREGRAGVQDEGSQLVAWALAKTEAPEGPWLDMCAGPGGKAALLGGLAKEQGQWLLAAEAQQHRSELVAGALSCYHDGTAVITCDGTKPAWPPGQFSKVMADVPCTGLGALRRRPEARWRRSPEDLARLADLQRNLLRSALTSAMTGGVVAYVTCSPHRAETVEIVEEVLAEYPSSTLLLAADYLNEVPNAQLGDYLQLWPHRHGTDAMFLALLRR